LRCYHRAPLRVRQAGISVERIRTIGIADSPSGGWLTQLSNEQLDQFWNDVQRSLARLVPENVYRIWLDHLSPTALEESTLYLELPEHMVGWVQRRFGATLVSAARAVDPLLSSVELLGKAGAFSSDRPLRETTPARDNPPTTRRLNPANTFSQFVICDGNRFAHAAALAVAELPAHAYNPLFIHGSSGGGKTHLLEAVANYVSTHEPQLTVHYLTAEAFATGFRHALQTSTLTAFKDTYRSANVLLIDDIDFFNNKKRSTEEFLFTVDELIGSNGQVVLSGNVSPADMPFLGDRLQERLQCGLVTKLDQPDPPARFAILRKRAPQLKDHPDHTLVLQHLADHVGGNVRTLEGALIRVHAYASLTQQPLTVALADHVLSNLEPSADTRASSLRNPSIQDIQRHISGALDLPVEDLSSPKRGRQVVYARHVAMYLCRELTPLSLPAISAQFGGRDHTTVLHAHRKIKQRLLTDADTRALVQELRSALVSG